MNVLAEHQELKVAPGNHSFRASMSVKPQSLRLSWTDGSHVAAVPAA